MVGHISFCTCEKAVPYILTPLKGELFCIKCVPSQWSNISNENEIEVVLLKYETEDYRAWCPQPAGCLPPRVLLTAERRGALRAHPRLSSTISWAARPQGQLSRMLFPPSRFKQTAMKVCVQPLRFFPPSFVPHRHRFAKWCTDTWASLQARPCWGPPEGLSPSWELDRLWKKVNIL